MAETVVYQFEAPQPLWDEWKDGVPRSKNLDERIIELMRKDIES